jgi:LPXTG-motif cell wall-anchored protein
MKPKRLVFGAVAVLVATALTSGVAAAQSQDGPQEIQSGNAEMPINVAGPSPTEINANYDTGNKISTFMAGQHDTNSSRQGADPQRRQPRDKFAPDPNNAAVPAEDAPRGANATNPGRSDPGTSSGLPSSGSYAITELPKTGGTIVPTSGIIGLLLVVGGLVVRKTLRKIAL